MMTPPSIEPFKTILLELTALIRYETTLLQEKKTAQALSLLPEKERIMVALGQQSAALLEHLSQGLLLEEMDHKGVLALCTVTKDCLLDNQQELTKTHENHDRFIQFCVDTLKAFSSLPSYTEKGVLQRHRPESLSVNQVL